MGRTNINLEELKLLESKFWSNVTKSDDCWIWNKYINKDGYGEFKFRLSKIKYDICSHRISYFFKTGVYDSNIVIRHTCDNTKCVNPNHLLQGTYIDNVADRVNRNRSATGINNGRSKLTEENVREIKNSTEKNHILTSKFNISRRVIYDIKKGKTWKHI